MLGRRATSKVAVDENVIALEEAPAGEEAAGVDLGEATLAESRFSPMMSWCAATIDFVISAFRPSEST